MKKKTVTVSVLFLKKHRGAPSVTTHLIHDHLISPLAQYLALLISSDVVSSGVVSSRVVSSGLVSSGVVSSCDGLPVWPARVVRSLPRQLDLESPLLVAHEASVDMCQLRSQLGKH